MENDISLAHAHATKQRDAKRERSSFFAPLSSPPPSHVLSPHWSCVLCSTELSLFYQLCKLLSHQSESENELTCATENFLIYLRLKANGPCLSQKFPSNSCLLQQHTHQRPSSTSDLKLPEKGNIT